MSPAEQLQPLLAKYSLQRVGAAIEECIRPAIHIRKQMRQEIVSGKPRFFGWLRGEEKTVSTPLPLTARTSHFGGRPEVAPDFQWPRWKGKPLGFLGQIYCEEIAPYDAERLWPNRGSLCFFYAIADCPWGGNAGDAGSWAVIYAKQKELHPAELPSDVEEDDLLPAYPVSFEVFPSLPSAPEGELAPKNLDDAEFEAFCELRAELHQCGRAESMHQTLGHPDAVQGPLEEEWEEFQQRMKRPSDGSDWKLLLQFDTDNELDVMWGDAGMLYFGLRENAFRAQRFDETQMAMQCC